MDLKILASAALFILTLPAIAYLDVGGRSGSEPSALIGTRLENTESIDEEFGKGWIYINFPGIGVYTLGEVTTEGTEAWGILQGFGGQLNGFQYIPLMTSAPSLDSGGIVLFMPPAQGCGGDFNNDGSVDFFDVLSFISAFDSESPDADLNSDNQINYIDLILFLGYFSSGC
jgi:hypothetical protein